MVRVCCVLLAKENVCGRENTEPVLLSSSTKTVPSAAGTFVSALSWQVVMHPLVACTLTKNTGTNMTESARTSNEAYAVFFNRYAH